MRIGENSHSQREKTAADSTSMEIRLQCSCDGVVKEIESLSGGSKDTDDDDCTRKAHHAAVVSLFSCLRAARSEPTKTQNRAGSRMRKAVSSEETGKKKHGE